MTTPKLILNGTVVQGALDPEALVVEIYPSAEVPDLSVVSSAELLIITPDQTEEIWSCAMTTQTSSKIVLAHPYVEGDTDTPGESLRIYPLLHAPAWPHPRRMQMLTLGIIAQ